MDDILLELDDDDNDVLELLLELLFKLEELLELLNELFELLDDEL